MGQGADIVILDEAHPALVARDGDAVLNSWIFAAGNVVRDVYAGGARVVVNGWHVERDDVCRRYTATLQRLLRQV